MNKRIFFSIVLFGAVFYAPWWVIIAIGVFGGLYFDSYYELIFAGFLVDLLYGVMGSIYLGYGVMGFSAGFAAFLFLGRIKRELR